MYRDLEKYEWPKTPYQQVQELLEKIKINEARVEVAKAHVRQNFREDVHGAVTLPSKLREIGSRPISNRPAKKAGDDEGGDG